MDNKKLELITETKQLEAFCKTLDGEKHITVDTEFLRERTYFAQLCLIQVTAPNIDTVALIDPLSKGIKMHSLWNVFLNPKILKVFHACSQDMEILYHEMGRQLPTPIFDTQVACMFVGLGHQIGYSSMIQQLCDHSIDKDNRYTDWAKRPLSQKQLDYAAADVTWLCQAYQTLHEKLQDMGRVQWVKEEMLNYQEPDMYAPQPERMGTRIKHRLKSKHAVALIYALATWRENKAMKKNRPRNHIMNDTAIIKLAANPPKTIEDIQTGRVKEAKSWAKDIIQIVETTDPNQKAEYSTDGNDHVRLTAEQSNIYDILNLALKCCAREHQLVPQLIACKNDLYALATGKSKPSSITALQGWRGEIFGDVAQKILKGQFFIGLRDGKIEFKSS